MSNRSPEKIGVLVVDDHDLVRQGVAKVIDNTPSLTIIGEAEGEVEARAFLDDRIPDVAVIDLSLKEGDAYGLIRHIAQNHPETKIVVLSIHEDAVHVEQALRAGAHGYVAKSAPADTLIEAIQDVIKGELFLPKELADRVLTRLQGDSRQSPSLDLLSERERKVFQLIGQGLTTRQIADEFRRSPKTVESHIERMKEKLRLDSARELHRLAYQHNAQSNDG